MSSPIQIYLDSADYSLIAEGKADSTRNQLIQLVNSGDIEIRYSHVTILECAQTAHKYRESAARRMEVVQDLCKNKTLIHYAPLMIKECEFLVRGGSSKRYSCDDNGLWYPNFPGNASDFKRELAQHLESMLSVKKVPRKKYKKYINNNQFTTAGLSFLDGIDKKILDLFPVKVSKKSRKLIRSYFQGRISDDDFEAELMRLTFNPLNLVEWALSQVDGSLEKFSWLRIQGQTLVESLDRARASISQFENMDTDKGVKEKAANELRHMKFEFAGKRDEILQSCWDKHKVTLEKKGISEKLWKEKVVASNLGAIPSMDTWMRLFSDHYKNSLLDNRRKLRRSDYGDINHGMYIPYVDIFRADKHMTERYKTIASEFDTEIVSSLKNLITSVNDRLKCK